MAGKHKRNIDKHTSAEQAESNILTTLRMWDATSSDKCVRLSELGYTAFPDYDFRAPQGAAFAVARIVRSMEQRKLLAYHCDDWRRGYYLHPSQPTNPLQGLLESAKAMGIGATPRKPGRSDTAA
ncbi:hypothetical protein AchV4_0043 [Achromobacter phage vB_AchrS_AchV4]|uniref:Uncharacterized protein n=1 Tax=Achromobacter phage vB_AchrS_AchV4 TaxID=2796514 RepID=A0A7T3PGX7_9CAUD|nr:hypothetical protein JT316_gp43 [Achromobacter phage vB_AchrS_AchV4]QPZ53281.1 hypothetical protein AchV4_0043 [Achromobacter phage vB_AchrS_AchV4]